MKIGLFGGAFNPPHRCHLAIAAQTRDRLYLDRIVFIPSGDPPHKGPESLAPAAHRLEMVRRAIAGDPSFTLSEAEIRRSAKSYTIETVGLFRNEYGPDAELFFLIGLDAFLDLPNWRQPGDLLRACHFVVVSRPGNLFRTLLDLSLLPPVAPAAMAALDAGRQDRLDVPIPGGTLLILLRLPPCDASASDIRARLRKRASVAGLLPVGVESYILQANLYREETDRTGVQG
jgi:nicotinate-nucleotide adenylyltransferase